MVDAGNVQVVIDLVSHLRVGTQLGGHGTHHRIDFIDVLTIGHTHIDHRMGKRAAAVGDRVNRAIGYVMHTALVITQSDIAKRHLLDQPAFASNLDHITLPHLVFQQQEQADEVILDQALRAKPNGDAQHPGGGQYGRNRNTHFAQHQHRCDQDNQHSGHIAKHLLERFQPLDPLQITLVLLHVHAHPHQCLA